MFEGIYFANPDYLWLLTMTFGWMACLYPKKVTSSFKNFFPKGFR